MNASVKCGRGSLVCAILLALAPCHAVADEWAWVDGLRAADQATKGRFKLCAASAAAHLAAIGSASFEFEVSFDDLDFKSVREPQLRMRRRTYHGRARWLRGAVHYEGRTESPETGEPPVSVLRTDKMLAFTERHELYGTLLVVDFPPPAVDDWERRRQSLLACVDPKLHFGPFARGSQELRKAAERWETVGSEERGGLVRLTCAGKGFRVDNYFDPAAGYLQVKYQDGAAVGGQHKILREMTWEWQTRGELNYPARVVDISYYGEKLTPVTNYDLRIKNVLVNESADVRERDVGLNALEIPDGTMGIDRRSNPLRSLVRAGGVVREQRPGDRIRLSPELKARIEQERSRAESLAESSARVTLARRWRWTALTYLCVGGCALIGAFLLWRFWVRVRAKAPARTT